MDITSTVLDKTPKKWTALLETCWTYRRGLVRSTRLGTFDRREWLHRAAIPLFGSDSISRFAAGLCPVYRLATQIVHLTLGEPLRMMETQGDRKDVTHV
jgi:hypothetical protein